MIWFLIFVLWPLAELFVIVKVAEWIGFVWMLLALLISWPVGTLVLKRQGRSAWRRLTVAMAQGHAPAFEVIDGVLVLFGGFLLLVPGFITDTIGLLLMFGPIRKLVRRGSVRFMGFGPLRWVVEFGGRDTSAYRGAGFAYGGRPRRGPDYDADSTGFDVDGPELNP
jgi:UPF0716 protein FxsA